MIDGFLDGSIKPVIHTRLPFITLQSLAPIERDEPAPSPAQVLDAQEAQRLMNLTNLLDATAPTWRETDRRIVLTEVDRLVQQMIGWREFGEVAPGLPVLVIPPRLFPEGWDQIAGVIRKKDEPGFHGLFVSPWLYSYFQRISWPSWLEEERERTARTFADEYLCEPLKEDRPQ